MPDSTPNPSPAILLSLLLRLKARMRLATRRLDGASMELDSIECELNEVFTSASAAAGVKPGPAPKPPRHRNVVKYQQALEAEARALAGAATLTIEWLSDGFARVCIDGKAVRLSALKANLLVILAADRGASPDALVSWKTRDEIRNELESRTGSKPSPRALNTLIWRLREALALQAGLPSSVIQKAAGRPWLRFALRRKQEEVML